MCFCSEQSNGSTNLQNSSKSGFGPQSDKKSSLNSIYANVQQNNNTNINNNNVINRRIVTTTASVPINLSHSTAHRMQSSPTVPVMQQKSPIGVHNTNTQPQLTLARGMSMTASHQCSQNNSNAMNGNINNKDHKKLDRSYSEPAEKNSQQLVRLNSASATVAGPMSSRYKTELCRSFGEVGTCKYGDKCQFAHGGHELRVITRHPKFKTENCKSFHSTGFCPYGPRCHFIHNSEESKKTVLNNLSGSGSENSPPNGVETNGSQNRFNDQIINSISINGNNGFVSTYHTTNGSTHPLRPKALSIGSYSLGSSGEISPPSSQSGSPTSLNSFFTEDPFHPFVSPNGHTLGSGANNAFSFSPDFASLMPNNNHNNNNNKTSGFGSQPTICQPFQLSGSLNADISEPSGVMPNMFSNKFQTSPKKISFEQHLNDATQGMAKTASPQASKVTPVPYPLAPDSPVDSIASDVEALKLDNNLSPPLPDCSSPLDVSKSLPRLPIFTRFANNGNNESE